ncbi:lysostaphin resistance A-like protein [Chloroflexota bacterium]
MSLSLPLTSLSLLYWYPIIYLPLIFTAWVAGRHLNYSAREMGLTVQKLPLQVLVALSGFVFAIVEYYILRPQSLITQLTWAEVLFPALVLMVSTGFGEEFIFRGLLQRASKAALGKWNVIYVALLFTSFHLIHLSVIDIIFVFVVGLFFGWVVNKTGSLLGVTLAHGITNIGLYLIIPLLLR